MMVSIYLDYAAEQAGVRCFMIEKYEPDPEGPGQHEVEYAWCPYTWVITGSEMEVRR